MPGVVRDCEECIQALQTLGVPSQSSDQDIKTSFRELVRVWHPDKHEQDPKLRLRAERESKKINVAFDHLKSHVGQEEDVCERPNSDVDEDIGSHWHTTQESSSWPTDSFPRRSHRDAPLAWRWIKVFLRIIWRLFKIVAMLVMGALVIICIVGELASYWSNETKRE